MAQTLLTQEGAFTSDLRNAINDMFTELYGSGATVANSAAYTKSSAGTVTFIPASTVDRTVQITVNITTTFADGDGAQPTLAIGQTSSTSKFAATTAFASKTAGTTLTFGGTLTAGTDLLLTQVAATGTTSTGAYTVTAVAIP